MNVIQKIALRIVLLLVIFIGISIVYAAFIFEKDLETHSPIISKIRNIPSKTDILYLGESSNWTYAEDDTDKSSISEMLSAHYPDLIIKEITKEATHAGIYKTYLERISTTKKINTVIVTLNLRSFGSAWVNSGLESPLQKSTVLLRNHNPLINRIMLSFKYYDLKTELEREKDMLAQWRKDELHFPYKFPYKNVREWDDALATEGLINPIGDSYDNTILACHYVKAYAFQIDTLTHPRIADFNEIVQLAKKRGWNLVFNLLGENVSKGEELVGKDLIYLMEQNRKLLVNYYSRKGVTVVDNMSLIANEYFIDQNWTTEHYTEEGRKIIAENIDKKIRINFTPNKN